MHQNQRNLLKLAVVVVLGILLDAVPWLLEDFFELSLPVLFTGTILVTILCGGFPGMVSATGFVLLRYALIGFWGGFDLANLEAPVYWVLYGVLIALLLHQFIRREWYRKPWKILIAILIIAPLIWILDRILSTVISGYYMEADESKLAEIWEMLSRRFSPSRLSMQEVALWDKLPRISVSTAVALAVYHLLPKNRRKELRDISWMQEPLPEEVAGKIRAGKKGYGHSLKSRITLLLVVALCACTLIIAIVGLRNTAELTEEGYYRVLKQAGIYAETLIPPQTAAEYLEKASEAEGYEQTQALLRQYVSHTDRLSRLVVLRIADGECSVVLDAPTEGAAQGFGEPFGEEAVREELSDMPIKYLDNWSIYDYPRVGERVYAVLWPILDDDGLPILIVLSEIRVPPVSENAILFAIRIVIEFSGFFILLISFGTWLSRYYMVYPITSMSDRAKQISGNLDDINRLDENIGMLQKLDIHTADETETLYKAVCQMAQSVSGRMKDMQSLFEETVMALVNAIDAKDQYTHGHSSRVAAYSRRIAELAGKDESECEEIYLSALLHDVGKIGVPEAIINKKGRLTDEEFAAIKQHPGIGYKILKEIKEYPYLSVAAHYHHERYNGRGYPEGLKGEEIPEIGRIIAVADAYDAMTSNRSYRHAIPQHIVREELVKGSGTQFDPAFARLMIQMIDQDTEYRMQETESGADQAPTTSLRCESIYHDCTEGIIITRKMASIHLCSQPDDGFGEDESLPTLIVFDSLDGRVHPGEENNRDLLYFEYARIRLDGQVTQQNARKVEVRTLDQETDLEQAGFGEPESGQRYKLTAARYRDHAIIRISDEKRTFEVILALPDASRYVYIAIGGEHCCVHNILVESGGEEIGPNDIPRIAEEISFIKGCPEGDVPNLQVDGWRSDATGGIPIQDGMTLSFHSMSLPTARLVWHCPFISVFSSEDGQVNGADFREYMLLRLDGENWESDDHVENRVQVEQRESFGGWNAWKDENKKGLDCVVTIQREKNVITMRTENLGIAIRSVTTIRDDVKDVYVALTGDQCAITNIRVSRGK